MRVGSLFSGVGGLDLGLTRAGFEHVFFCESDAYRRSILAYHWPGVPIFEDVRGVAAEPSLGGCGEMGGGGSEPDAGRAGSRTEDGDSGPDLLCGGFPCQDLSVAGRRAGLDGARSGLFFEFARVADALRPEWILIENVPGLLSSPGRDRETGVDRRGADFGVVLGTLAEIGYGMAWRTLDSRFFDVPQRRERVFILGNRIDGDPRATAERAGHVLGVGTWCERHSGKSRKTWTSDTSSPEEGAGEVNGNGWLGETASTLQSLSDGGLRMDADSIDQLVPAVTSKWKKNCGGPSGDETQNLVVNDLKVRRLMPIECERLQALPDSWTDPYGTAANTNRYAAIGDAVTASVAEWLGRRILACRT